MVDRFHDTPPRPKHTTEHVPSRKSKQSPKDGSVGCSHGLDDKPVGLGVVCARCSHGWHECECHKYKDIDDKLCWFATGFVVGLMFMHLLMSYGV